MQFRKGRRIKRWWDAAQKAGPKSSLFDDPSERMHVIFRREPPVPSPKGGRAGVLLSGRPSEFVFAQPTSMVTSRLLCG